MKRVAIESRIVEEPRSVAIGEAEAFRGVGLKRPNPLRGRLTPLMIAAIKGNERIVKTLLKAGAKVNCKDETGQTAFMHAAGRGSVGVLRLLANAKARKGDRNIRGASAIHIASAEGHLEAVRFLLDAGGKADSRDDRGAPPSCWRKCVGTRRLHSF